jgi:sugar/nucleoside kinase (ribokinase family)
MGEAGTIVAAPGGCAAGDGGRGDALLALPSAAASCPAGATGAGDTLAAGVVDGFLRGLLPGVAVERAQRFVAAYLAGHAGPAARWISAPDLDRR